MSDQKQVDGSSSSGFGALSLSREEIQREAKTAQGWGHRRERSAVCHKRGRLRRHAKSAER
jgi:hypothetical protein